MGRHACYTGKEITWDQMLASEEKLVPDNLAIDDSLPIRPMAIPGVAETPAGRNGAFLTYEEAYFFNLGPRAGQALAEFVTDLYAIIAG